MKYLTKKTVLDYIKNEKLHKVIDKYAATIDGDYIFYYDSDEVVKVNSEATFRDWLLCILEAGWDYYYGYFVSVKDAWEYLQKNNITDFKDAIKDGYTNIVSIANHYYFENSTAEIDDAAAELMKSYNKLNQGEWLC